MTLKIYILGVRYPKATAFNDATQYLPHSIFDLPPHKESGIEGLPESPLDEINYSANLWYSPLELLPLKMQ